MKILFVMDRRVNAGSIQAISSYTRAGNELGYTIAMYGPDDPQFPNIRFSTNVHAFDYVVFIFESKLHWMSGMQLAHILASVPRERRAILDADGMYNQAIHLDGYDRNHAHDRERSEWLTLYDQLADKILQPTYAPREARVIPLPFYGYDRASQMPSNGRSCKRVDIMHVGHNWWRWHQVQSALLPALQQIRSLVGVVCFVGSWWDAAPPWAGDLDLEDAFCVEREHLRRASIEIRPPVPYTQVIRTMSEGRVNIMTQRPLFRHLRFLTAKYFEIFCADTIPLVMLDPDHAASIYGPLGRELALHDGIAERLRDVLDRPAKYRRIVQGVRDYIAANHSYQNRVRELVVALEA
jgi:hypothetical protein